MTVRAQFSSSILVPSSTPNRAPSWQVMRPIVAAEDPALVHKVRRASRPITSLGSGRDSARARTR
jgi:hypothetical protein